jgi:mitochondrial inner membrane protein COX18
MNKIFNQQLAKTTVYISARHVVGIQMDRRPLLAKPKTLSQSTTRNFSYEKTVAEIFQTISNSTPVEYIQHGLLQLHDTTGLPWWATIVLSTVMLRTCITMPLAIYQNKILARVENLSLEMPAIVKELKQETAYAMKKFNWTEKQARILYNRSLKKQWNKLIVRDNCHPAKTMILLWGQIPLWICQSVALRNLINMLPDPSSLEAKITYTELTIGGFGWIPNLTEVDQSFIIPVVLGLTNLAIIEMQTMLRVRQQSRFQKYTVNFFRLISIGMVPLACYVPSALSLYWVTSSVYGLTQNLILLSPRVKRAVGIPKTPSEHEHPYQHLVDSLRNRLTFGGDTSAKKEGNI